MGTATTVLRTMAAAVVVAWTAAIGTVSINRTQTMLLIVTSGRRSYTGYLLETPSHWTEVSFEARYKVVSLHVSSGHESFRCPYLVPLMIRFKLLTAAHFDTAVSLVPLYLRSPLFSPQSPFSPTLGSLMAIEPLNELPASVALTVVVSSAQVFTSEGL